MVKMSVRKTLMNSKDLLSSGTYVVFGIFALTKKVTVMDYL